jgi:hypothetical protein
MCRVVSGAQLHQRLERFQGLTGALEADGAGQEVMFDRGLSDDRANEIVGQEVRSNLLMHQLGRLAADDYEHEAQRAAGRVDLALMQAPAARELADANQSQGCDHKVPVIWESSTRNPSRISDEHEWHVDITDTPTATIRPRCRRTHRRSLRSIRTRTMLLQFAIHFEAYCESH